MILIGLKENKIIITDVVLLFALFFANASDDVARHQSKYSVEEIANRFEESAINKGNDDLYEDRPFTKCA